ncbi:hypothetical protein [Brevibacterium aurantiacum]|uniref:Uncharacterized protein n=1 Tax=Brevibacterium aurantiacum TaxID=273384 RepID=A0A4Z0KHE0_BREAU|nr:hypothetical protein [Brevibacterium aurantiacum]TGD36696.1 hypothetical protein EB834_18565 [Brevibacterium aurantiacum]
MSNMSYCRHENTSSDLRDVLAQWDDWAEEHPAVGASDYESRARRSIMEQAVSLTRALEERQLLLEGDDIAPHAEYQVLDMPFLRH